MQQSKKSKVAGYKSVGSPARETFLNGAVTMRFQIHGFGLRKERRGKNFYTGSVIAFGYPWKLAIYPRGHPTSSTDAEYVSIYLSYFSPDCNSKFKSVVAEATIRTKSRELKVGKINFCPTDEQTGWGTKKFSKRDDILSKDCDDNGTLTIDVDIEVAKERKLIRNGLRNVHNSSIRRKRVHRMPETKKFKFVGCNSVGSPPETSLGRIPETKKFKFVGCNSVGSPPETSLGEAITMRFQIREFGQRKEERGEKFFKRYLDALNHPWKLMIFPRGNVDSSTDVEFVSIYLLYCPGCNNNCQAVVTSATIRTKTKWKEISRRSFHQKQPIGFSNFSKRDDILSEDCDENGTLTIEVDIRAATEKKSILYPLLEKSDNTCAKLHNSTETADVIFTVGSNGKEFKAHKSILLLEANVLHELIMMESKKRSISAEGLINVVLPNVNESLFEAMMTFIYSKGKVGPKIKDEITARNILLVACQFNCRDLKSYTESLIVENILDSSSTARLLLFADAHSLALLKEACMNAYISNPKAVMASQNDWRKVQESNKLLTELLIYTSSGRGRRSSNTKSDEGIKSVDSLDVDSLALNSLGMSSLRVLY